jgi:hypothetical protein
MARRAFTPMKYRDAFDKRTGICYIPEAADAAYSYYGILAIAKNNEALALIIFDLCEWQHPETIFDELLREGEIDEKGNILDKEFDHNTKQLTNEHNREYPKT